MTDNHVDLLLTASDAREHTTPNAVMRTLAAPSTGAQALSVWEVRMQAGAAGPMHAVDREQVWTVLAGGLRVEHGDRLYEVGPGDALRLPAGGDRRVTATTSARAIVASEAAPAVTTPDGGTRALPWAA